MVFFVYDPECKNIYVVMWIIKKSSFVFCCCSTWLGKGGCFVKKHRSDKC